MRAAPVPPTVRMEPIATLPVFFKLAGKRVVLAGGTPPAAWKAELLAAAGASVDVYAAEPCEALVHLAAAPPGGCVRLIPRAWTADDLRDAALALGAIEAPDEAGRFRDAAHARGVPVNVIDNPPFCDFQFGTVVSRSPLVIGISTDGAAPVFGQAIRARIEALLPASLKAWAEAARDWRPAVQAQGLDFRRRRAFWEAFAARALGAADRPPEPADLAACLEAVTTAAGQAGTITLVGAGEGSLEGVTLGAVRALQAADVVVHPALLSPAIVNLARREAEKIAYGDAEPWAILKAALAEGRRLVWLEGGNPARCAAWARRAAGLQELGYTPASVAGLGRCSACNPACPAWEPDRA